jgi:hypothetical protein
MAEPGKWFNFDGNSLGTALSSSGNYSGWCIHIKFSRS